MVLNWSEYPYVTLRYLADGGKRYLKQPALCRQDKILNALDSGGIVRTLFNDYVSAFSPLSSEVGDEYYLTSTRFMTHFLSS